MDLFFGGTTAVVGQTGPIGFVGPVPVYLFGVTTAAGVLVGLAVGLLQAERFGLSLSRTFEGAVWSVVAGFAGARIGYVLIHWGDYRQAVGSAIRLSEGGFLFHGALLGGVAALLVYAWLAAVDPWRTLDSLAPGLALGQAVGLIGAQVLGQATSMPWGVVVQETVIHPLPAYGIVLAYGLFFLLWRFGGGKLRPGSLFLTYLLLHGVGSLLLGIWSSARTHWGMTPTQWGGVMAFVVAWAVMFVRRREPLVSSAAGGLGTGWNTAKYSLGELGEAVGFSGVSGSSGGGSVRSEGRVAHAPDSDGSRSKADRSGSYAQVRRGVRGSGRRGSVGARVTELVLWVSGMLVLLGLFAARLR